MATFSGRRRDPPTTMNDALREKLAQLPDKPGCYIMRDRHGVIIYVGKAVSLRRRVQSYFRASTMVRGAPKVRSMVKSVESLEWIVVRTEADALLAESDLIKRYKPYYNILLRDDKRFLALRVDPRDPWPRLTACRIVRDDNAEYFGPFPSSSVVRTVLDFAERRFGLRKCAPLVPDAETYRHCHNDVLPFCSAPCAGRISREDYHARVAEACEFLRGHRPQVMDEVRAAMEAAAAARDFEKAAALRDTFLAMKEMVRQRGRPAANPQIHRLDAAHGVAELGRILHLPGPAKVIEGFDISNTFGTLSVASMVCAVDGMPVPNRYRRFRIQTVEGADDPRSIAEAVTRRYRRLRDESQPFPDLILIDGGITQLRAARAALAGLGLSIPTVGLAERFETLVTDGVPPGPDPVLDLDSSPLMVLRQLRDEAHRFAITNHRRLRNRLIRESALDDIPGIGPRKKMLLLRTFGSVYRLAKAPASEIAAVPGIGAELAAAILRAIGNDGENAGN